MSMEERSSASEWTKEQQVRYEDILKQETERARQERRPHRAKSSRLMTSNAFRKRPRKTSRIDRPQRRRPSQTMELNPN
jgi:hypothetical protein